MKKDRPTKEKMDRKTSMKIEQNWNGLYPVAADGVVYVHPVH